VQSRRANGDSEGEQIGWMCFIFVYQNRTMKPVEFFLRSVGGPMRVMNKINLIYGIL
jgi:hypothetical protein